MWSNLNESEMTLPSKHARLFCAAVGFLSDQIGWTEQEDWWDDDHSVFDRLTQGQKQSVLLEVTRALLDKRAEAPPVTAVRAAAVAQVYQTVVDLITADIETDGDTEMRTMLLEAVDEADYWENVNLNLARGEPLVVPLSPACNDVDEWAYLVEVLCDTVLDDRDFEMEGTFSDLDPEETAELRRQMSIGPDYFTDVPEDPTPEQLEQIRRELLDLLPDERDYTLSAASSEELATYPEEFGPVMGRYHLLAAEIFAYSFANYANHLGIGNIRYDEMMPNDARTLERAENERWPVDQVAQSLDVTLEVAASLQRRFRQARDVVDAKNPAESFRWAVRQSIEAAVAEGLRDEPSIERLVTQICYRASDLAYLLDQEGTSLSRYSRQLRTDVADYEEQEDVNEDF
jgi:hypothetical protein